jgi:hypothetical protein
LFETKERPKINFMRYEFWWNKDKELLDKLLQDNDYFVFQDQDSYADKIAIHKSYFE